jgi:hypothetical protein
MKKKTQNMCESKSFHEHPLSHQVILKKQKKSKTDVINNLINSTNITLTVIIHHNDHGKARASYLIDFLYKC